MARAPCRTYETFFAHLNRDRQAMGVDRKANRELTTAANPLARSRHPTSVQFNKLTHQRESDAQSRL